LIAVEAKNIIVAKWCLYLLKAHIDDWTIERFDKSILCIYNFQIEWKFKVKEKKIDLNKKGDKKQNSDEIENISKQIEENLKEIIDVLKKKNDQLTIKNQILISYIKPEDVNKINDLFKSLKI
jgi:hypothetical protein